MGLIKRADIEQYTRDAYVMDLDDLESRGKAVVASANAEAESILAMAKAQRKKLLSTAQQEGYDKGQRDGYEQGYIDGVVNGVEDAKKDRSVVLDGLINIWSDQLDEFELKRDMMLAQARSQVVELAAMLAQRIVRKTIDVDATVVLSQMEAILSTITESTRLVISVHPDDIAVMQHSMEEMLEKFATCEHAQVVSDPSLIRGSVVASTTSGGIIDSSISTQLERVLEAILPTNHSIPDLGSLEHLKGELDLKQSSASDAEAKIDEDTQSVPDSQSEDAA
jgi:flagellar assembly protein FliH